MTGAIAGQLSNGNYYDACKEFVSKVELNASQGVPKGAVAGEAALTLAVVAEVMVVVAVNFS